MKKATVNLCVVCGGAECQTCGSKGTLDWDKDLLDFEHEYECIGFTGKQDYYKTLCDLDKNADPATYKAVLHE